MKAAIVRAAGAAPVYADFAEPVPGAEERRVTVTAAAISPVVRSRAAGTHYSASGQFPFVVGVDGVGRLDDGQRVYFAMPRAPFGSMAERAVAALCVPLPEGLDDVTAAAIANPAMSSWVAYAGRARLKRGETVLVNGATGSAGRLAVAIARHLGAGKVIATGRNVEALRQVEALGADATIPLVGDGGALERRVSASFAQGVDVVIDYLWGNSAEHLLVAAAKARSEAPLRFVQIGSASGPDINLPSAVLRAAPIEIMGSGLGSMPLDRLPQSIGEMFEAAVAAGFGIATEAMPLSEVETAWARAGTSRRVVLTIHGGRD